MRTLDYILQPASHTIRHQNILHCFLLATIAGDYLSGCRATLRKSWMFEAKAFAVLFVGWAARGRPFEAIKAVKAFFPGASSA